MILPPPQGQPSMNRAMTPTARIGMSRSDKRGLLERMIAV